MNYLKQSTQRVTISVIISVIAYSVLPGTGAADVFPKPGDFVRGAKTWAENCGRCHNIRAANELRDDQWITTMFHMRVRSGMTGQETRDVLTFLQRSNTSMQASYTADEKSTKQTLSGKDVYNQTCIACHGASGAGMFPGVPDFNDKSGPLAKSDDVLTRNIISGYQSPNSPMAMPPNGGNPDLTQAEVISTLGYIRKEFGK